MVDKTLKAVTKISGRIFEKSNAMPRFLVYLAGMCVNIFLGFSNFLQILWSLTALFCLSAGITGCLIYLCPFSPGTLTSLIGRTPFQSLVLCMPSHFVLWLLAYLKPVICKCIFVCMLLSVLDSCCSWWEWILNIWNHTPEQWSGTFGEGDAWVRGWMSTIFLDTWKVSVCNDHCCTRQPLGNDVSK